MEPEIDLAADLNAEDDDGLCWTVLSDARDPSRVRPGAMLVAVGRAPGVSGSHYPGEFPAGPVISAQWTKAHLTV